MGRMVAVGRILRPHGVEGEMTIARYGDAEEILAPGRRLRAQGDSGETTLTVVESRPSMPGRWLVTFEEIGIREEASVLQGWELMVDETELPELEEGRYYRFQVLGLEAVTLEGESLGKVEEIWETGANDVYVVRGPRGEILVPVIESVVREIDVEGGKLVLTPLEGLIPEEDPEAEARAAKAAEAKARRAEVKQARKAASMRAGSAKKARAAKNAASATEAGFATEAATGEDAGPAKDAGDAPAGGNAADAAPGEDIN